MRRIVVALAVSLGLTAGLPAATGFNFDGSIPGRKAIPAICPDPRVRWEPFPVGGYGLCRPDTCITLPPGATLWLPFAQHDTLWERE